MPFSAVTLRVIKCFDGIQMVYRKKRSWYICNTNVRPAFHENMTPRSIGIEVLDSLVDGIDLLFEWASGPREFRRNHFSGEMSRQEWEELMRPVKERQAVKRLQKKKWLAARKEGDRIIYRLHHDAMVAVLRERIRKNNKKLPKGSHCLVIFDFPVGANKARSFWRRFLRSADFTQKQLSAWISDKDVVHDVQALIDLLDVKRRVSVYLANDPS